MEISHEYDDIIDLPHHVSAERPHMPMIDRAAQFKPFAALTDAKRELTEEQKEAIGKQLRALQARLKADPQVSVTCFVPDGRKAGGAYRTITGTARKVDETRGILEMRSGAVIAFDDIISLE